MKLKLTKPLVYPIMILSLIAIIVIAAYSLLNSIGSRMNPPQPVFKFEASISPATVWLREDGLWMVNREARLSVFDTDNERFKSGSKELQNQEPTAFGEVLLLVVRESLAKEKAKSLLEVLAGFNLKKVYLASPYDDTMMTLKKLEPRFWYAASPRSWVKWSLFSTFGIEKAFTQEADYLLVDDEISKLMSEKLKSEIKRRRLPMIKAARDGILFIN